MKGVTPITRAPSSLPDPHAQTQQLIAALSKASEAVAMQAPQAIGVINDLTVLIGLASPPPESYPELTTLDDAIADALEHLPELCRHAPEAELRQTLKTLRRIILSDRRRIDPDPARHALYIAIALRQTWLIAHRSGLLHARSEQARVRQMLERMPADHPDRPALVEHERLLNEYLAAQEGYGASVQRELTALQGEINK